MNRNKFKLVIPLLLIIIFSCTGESSVKSIYAVKENSGSTINLNVYDTLTVKLAGNPTTGYSWSAAKIDSSKLKFIEKIYLPKKPSLTGSGGTEIFKYSAIEPGSSELKMIYSRSWERDTPPVDSINFTIQINM